MESNTSRPVTSDGVPKNLSSGIKWLSIGNDITPEDSSLKELFIHPDLIPFVPLLIVLIVVLTMTTIKYVIHALKIRSIMRTPREE